MNGRYLQLDSPDMGRKVHLWCFGHFGLPVLVFPSAAGFAHEWQAQGMIETLSPLLAAGKIKLYCPESNVAKAWTNKEMSLDEKMEHHRQYERFILNTMVPFIEKDCHWKGAPITVTGCSLGAMYAGNFALKHPHLFKRAICMSGRYLATEFTDGQSNAEVYFNSPLAFVRGLSGGALNHVQKNTHMTLICGRGAYEEGCIEETIMLGNLLKQKGIPSHTDIWGKESRHGWGWWKKQASMYFNHYFG